MSTPRELLSPFSIGNLRLLNRVVMAPMTRARAGAEKRANDLMAKYYCQRASTGLIITEGMFPSPMGVGWLHAPEIYSHEMAIAWRPVVEPIHEAGGRVFCQLWHTWRASHSDFLNGKLPIAPSAIRHEGGSIPTPKSDGKELEHETPRALKADQVPGIVEEFRSAADRAKFAGFDGVEIHYHQ